MKILRKTKLSFCFIGLLLFPLVAFSASQDKINVTDEKHTVEGDFFYLNIPEGGILLPGSVLVKDAKTGKVYKNGHNYIAYDAHAEESGFTNSIYVTMPPGDGEKIEPIPQGTEVLVSYEYILKGEEEKEKKSEIILGKISDNYALIKDMAASISDTSQVGNNPPKTTIRDMVMKSPDKMKISSPDVTIITDGAKTIIKEPGQEPVTLNALDYTVETTPSQMDYFYHLSEFMERHRVEVVSNESKGVYILDAYPETEEKLYSKLRIKVNTQDKVELYNEIYDETGKLMYKKETLDYNKIGSITVPSKYQETTYLGTGNITNTAELQGIRLNTGVSDEEFK